jgi:hypothetical protein
MDRLDCRKVLGVRRRRPPPLLRFRTTSLVARRRRARREQQPLPCRPAQRPIHFGVMLVRGAHADVRRPQTAKHFGPFAFGGQHLGRRRVFAAGDDARFREFATQKSFFLLYSLSRYIYK